MLTADAWPITCPACRAVLAQSGPGLVCRCGAYYASVHGAWRMLLPGQRAALQEFLDAYTSIRRAEGRASDRAADYLALPDCPAAHPLAAQWRLRRQSYRALLPLLGRLLRPGARIVDLGAGNGWLSHRLAEGGYRPCAVDASADAGDGLGAARHLGGGWPRLVADFDRLPLADAAADAVLFNASFHYSTDYAATLREALRVARDGGYLLVMDTPVYRDPASGRRMLAERAAEFAARYGRRSDSRPVEGFLTPARLGELGRDAGLRWRRVQPWYGWRWAVAPLVNRWRGVREPPRFPLLWAERPARGLQA